MAKPRLSDGFRATRQALRGELAVGCTSCESQGCDDCDGGTVQMGFRWSKPLHRPADSSEEG